MQEVYPTVFVVGIIDCRVNPVGIASEAAGNGITSVAVRLDGVGTVAA